MEPQGDTECFPNLGKAGELSEVGCLMQVCAQGLRYVPSCRLGRRADGANVLCGDLSPFMEFR